MSRLIIHPDSDDELLVVRPGKWTLVVVARLREETLRFSVLQRRLKPISQKTLSSTLRDLERDGFISRTHYPTIPPRVDYALTELGREFLDVVDGLRRFAGKNRVAVEAARTRFDAGGGEPAIRLVSSR